jgi:hypothetical protein
MVGLAIYQLGGVDVVRAGTGSSREDTATCDTVPGAVSSWNSCVLFPCPVCVSRETNNN